MLSIPSFFKILYQKTFSELTSKSKHSNLKNYITPLLLYSNILIPLCGAPIFLLSGEVFSQWDKYPTYDEYVSYMEQWEEDYPELAKLYDLGPAGVASTNHRIYAMRISANVTQDEKEPSFLYTSSIHGDELTGYVSMLHLIDYLLINYEKDTLVTQLVDSIDIWIAPLCNPDGTYKLGDHTVQGAQRRNVADNFDLNRNFPCPCRQGDHQYYGIYSYTTKEIEAIRSLIESNDFVMSADLHGGAEAAVIPWCSSARRTVDDNWFEYVSRKYADIVNDNSPSGYFQMGVIPCCDPLSGFESHGENIDYILYFNHCRGIRLELSVRKLLDESDLIDHWEYNYRSFLNYMQQALYGLRGTVIDSITGQPIEKAKVFIEDHDMDSSFVYTNSPHGDYYRPIYAGTYDVTYSCPGYQSKTFTGIQVENNKATIRNVQLSYGPINIISKPDIIHGISIDIRKGFILIESDFPLNNDMKIEIYDLMGRIVKTIPACEKILWEEGYGMYIVRLVGKGINRQYKAMVSK